MLFPFLKLKVYEKARSFSFLICELLAPFKEPTLLIDLLKREGLEIVQTIAYASTFQNDDALRQQSLIQARGVGYQLVPLLEMGRKKKLFSELNYEVLLEELESLTRMLSNLIFSLEDSFAKEKKGKQS